MYKKLIQKEKKVSTELAEFEKKNQLLSTKLNLDYVEMLYREKLKYGKKDFRNSSFIVCNENINEDFLKLITNG